MLSVGCNLRLDCFFSFLSRFPKWNSAARYFAQSHGGEDGDCGESGENVDDFDCDDYGDKG